MALNDKFQLTNYGSEVQKAIDDALIHIPQDLALKAYRDEVLTKTQITPYTPTQNYHPATKLYVDTDSQATNQRLDEEITRAKAAENELNIKQVLLFDTDTQNYKYVNLITLDNTTQALIEESAVDAKIAELNTGFFIFYQVDADTGVLVEGRAGTGVNPQEIVNVVTDLPATATENDIAFTLGTDPDTIDVYKYDGTNWVLLASPGVTGGWLFAEESSRDGYYWFAERWHLVNMEVDMSQYYTKTETDQILTEFVRNDDLIAVSEITSLGGTITVTGTDQHGSRNIEVANGLYQPLIKAGSIDSILTQSDNDGVLGTLTKINTINTTASAQVNTKIPTEKAVGDYITYKLNNIDLSGLQTTIPAGTANNIVAYSGTAGTVNSLTRVNSIEVNAANRNNLRIPSEFAVGAFVENYKPVIITQGNLSTSVTTSQLAFWIEQ